MGIKIIKYQKKYFSQLALLFDEFMDYLVSIDTLGRCRRLPGFGAKELKKDLKSIKEQRGIFYIALVERRVIGFTLGFMKKKYSSRELLEVYPAKIGEIDELYVTQKYRNKGLGTKLIKMIEQYFKKQKCQYIYLSVFAQNHGAHRFYESRGFKDSAVYMLKKLK